MLCSLERWADEYVAEHGMASHYSSILRKRILFNINKSTKVKNEASKAAEVLQHTHKFIKVHRSIKEIIQTNNTLGLRGAYVPYETAIDRIELTKKNTYKLFKQRDLSPKVKKHLSKQIEVMDDDIKELKKIRRDNKNKLRINPITRAWNNIINKALSNKLIITPGDKFSNDLEKLYFKMHERNESFIKNKFDWYDYKISSKVK